MAHEEDAQAQQINVEVYQNRVQATVYNNTYSPMVCDRYVKGMNQHRYVYVHPGYGKYFIDGYAEGNYN